ncbi:hypothetical protein Patl1_35661 [Pistacia atlantica]|nr:hypothetical protein Patl1_35661 [Pistacia atlantica]
MALLYMSLGHFLQKGIILPLLSNQRRLYMNSAPLFSGL